MADPALRPATVHGYADRLSVAPGETIEFKVSCDEPGSYRADLVRLIHGDTNPVGPGVTTSGVGTASPLPLQFSSFVSNQEQVRPLLGPCDDRSRE